MPVTDTPHARLPRAIGSLGAGLLMVLAFVITGPYDLADPLASLHALLHPHGVELTICALLLATLTYRGFALHRIDAEQPPRVRRALAVLAIVFALLNVAGADLAYSQSFLLGHGRLLTLVVLVRVAGYALAFYELSFVVLHVLGAIAGHGAPFDSPLPAPWRDLSSRRLFALAAVVLLACWTPWLVAYYPATVDFDTTRQLAVSLGYWPPSNHDPWLSSWILGAIFAVGRNLGSDNLGMFLFVALRAVAMAALYAWVVVRLRDCGVPFAACAGAVLYLAVVPVWGAYAKQPWKDTFTAALFCAFAMSAVLLVRGSLSRSHERGALPNGARPNAPRPKGVAGRNQKGLPLLVGGRLVGASGAPADGLDVRDCARYAVTGLLVSLFRHNYYYVVLLTSICLAVLLLRHHARVALVASLFVASLGYLGFNYVITHVGGVEPANPVEALALPFQQTARTLRDHAEEVSAADRADVGRLLDANAIGTVYDPVISDPVKNTRNPDATGADYLAYFGAWARMGLAFPASYAEAAVAHTYGYYAFTQDGYPAGGNGNCGMVILEGINLAHHHHFDEYFDLHYVDGLGWLRGLLRRWANLWHAIPVLNITDCLPAYTWLLVLMMVYVTSRRGALLAMPVAAALLAVLTCMASPVNGSFRYLCPVAAATVSLLACLPPPASQHDNQEATDEGVLTRGQ